MDGDALRAATPQVVLSMRPCTVKADEEKSKHAGLAQENGFAAHAHRCSLRCKRRSKTCASAREECNKYDLTVSLPGFHWPNITERV